ncbi:hypothetical protein EXVG_00165 [Emiliania huxleyi virus 202]|nr:hypothetical protein EXVG_00165 [Emiliania huxleyi virus 202]
MTFHPNFTLAAVLRFLFTTDAVPRFLFSTRRRPAVSFSYRGRFYVFLFYKLQKTQALISTYALPTSYRTISQKDERSLRYNAVTKPDRFDSY